MMAHDQTSAAVVRKVQMELLVRSFGFLVQEVCHRGIGYQATMEGQSAVEEFAASLQRHLEESSKDWLARQLTDIE